MEFTSGNQTAGDCIIDGVSTQAKTYNIEKRVANVSHKVNGKKTQAYSASDGVQQLLEGKKTGAYYTSSYKIHSYLQPIHASKDRCIDASHG